MMTGPFLWRALPGFVCLALCLVTRLEADGTFGLVAEVTLAPAPDGSGGMVVTEFSPLISTSAFPGRAFESRPALGRIVGKIKPPRLDLPVGLDHLMSAIQSLDAEREWQPLESMPSTAGFHALLLRYRQRAQGFTIELHLQGETPDAAPQITALESTPGVNVLYRGTADTSPDKLTGAMTQAGELAWTIALGNGHTPGTAGGDKDVIRKQLSDTFLLPVEGAAPDYVARLTAGVASGLNVQPVFVPREITVELAGWKKFEVDQEEGVATRLRKRRNAHEKDIRAELDSLLPPEHSLVTAAALAEWQASALGEKYGLVPLHYSEDRLVLGASDFASEQTYIFKVGASHDSTDGLQATASAQLLHDRQSHLEAGLEAAYGEEADSADFTMQWAPRKPVSGWALNSTASLGARRNDEALFAATTGTEPVGWRRWRFDVGITAHRDAPDPSPGTWSSDIAAGLHLVHRDDSFDATDAIPEEAALPDTLAEIRAEWKAATVLRKSDHHLIVISQLRAGSSIDALDGNYNYQLAECTIDAALVTSSKENHSWKTALTARAGWLDGTAPISQQFRAGGDSGWIRGLEEGELMGTQYWSMSLAAGPDISALLGRGGEGSPATFLLAFYDCGGVADAGSWTAAQSFGAAINLAAMPVGAFTASLLFGYAYSPDSEANPTGAFFVRVNLPFVQ